MTPKFNMNIITRKKVWGSVLLCSSEHKHTHGEVDEIRSMPSISKRGWPLQRVTSVYLIVKKLHLFSLNYFNNNPIWFNIIDFNLKQFIEFKN